MNLKYLPAALLMLTSAGAMGQSPSKWLRDSVPAQWQMTPQATQTVPSEDAWWQTFNDPVLDSLINMAVANNYNVAAALKRIDMAQNAIRQAQAGYWPTLSLSGGWNRSQASGAAGPEVVPSSVSSAFSAGAQMNWEIDVFGRVQAGVKAKKAAYRASRADYDGVMVSLCSTLASTYMTLRQCQEQLNVAEAHIKSQQNVVNITKARFEAELADMLDVTQAKIVLYNTQTQLPALRAQIRTLANSLATLTGLYPGQLNDMLMAERQLPHYALTFPTGVPADLLRRRPDIVEAEMTLGEYAAMVGVAKKDFLPTLTLTGSIGTTSHKLDHLFGAHSMAYSVSPQLSWVLFDGGARHYRTADAKLQLEAAADSYNLTVQNAVEEVDNAIITYNGTLQSIAMQEKVVEQSEKSLKLAIDLYTAGLTAFSNVVDGQMNWLESQNTLVTLKGKACTGLVKIYQALGGGWQPYDQQ